MRPECPVGIAFHNPCLCKCSNITLDALKALKKERGDRVNILITSSVRDSGLSRMFNLVKNGSFSFSEDSGELFKAWLGNMKDMMCDEMGEVGMYFFHIPDPAHKKEKLTIHCIIGDSYVSLFLRFDINARYETDYIRKLSPQLS